MGLLGCLSVTTRQYLDVDLSLMVMDKSTASAGIIKVVSSLVRTSDVVGIGCSLVATIQARKASQPFAITSRLFERQ